MLVVIIHKNYYSFDHREATKIDVAHSKCSILEELNRDLINHSALFRMYAKNFFFLNEQKEIFPPQRISWFILLKKKPLNLLK
jgi:hypothetical protein